MYQLDIGLCPCYFFARHIQNLHGSNGAFVALRSDGVVLSWGDPMCGGDITPSVQETLRGL